MFEAPIYKCLFDLFPSIGDDQIHYFPLMKKKHLNWLQKNDTIVDTLMHSKYIVEKIKDKVIEFREPTSGKSTPFSKSSLLQSKGRFTKEYSLSIDNSYFAGICAINQILTPTVTRAKDSIIPPVSGIIFYFNENMVPCFIDSSANIADRVFNTLQGKVPHLEQTKNSFYYIAFYMEDDQNLKEILISHWEHLLHIDNCLIEKKINPYQTHMTFQIREKDLQAYVKDELDLVYLRKKFSDINQSPLSQKLFLDWTLEKIINDNRYSLLLNEVETLKKSLSNERNENSRYSLKINSFETELRKKTLESEKITTLADKHSKQFQEITKQNDYLLTQLGLQDQYMNDLAEWVKRFILFLKLGDSWVFKISKKIDQYLKMNPQPVRKVYDTRE